MEVNMKDILDFKRILLTDKYEVLQFPSYGDEIGYIVIEDMFRQQTKEEFESFLGIVDNSFEAADNFILVKVGVIRDLEENEQENINRLIDRLLGYLPDNYYFVDYLHIDSVIEFTENDVENLTMDEIMQKMVKQLNLLFRCDIQLSDPRTFNHLIQR